MNGKRFTALLILLLTLAIISLFLWCGSVNREADRLSVNLGQMQDSLRFLHRMVDSLKAQTPGLGEYMSTIQLHVAKLWYAGQSSNWKLATYELDELGETMEAAEGLHARKNDVDVSAVLQSIRQTQLPLIGQSITQADIHGFKSAYDQTLAACNGCHRPAGYEFIHIITPTREPVTNQLWKASKQ
jgi:hypothetical protein